MVAFLVDFTNGCPRFNDLSHIHLYDSNIVVFSNIRVFASIEIINMKLNILSLLFIVADDKCFDEFWIDLIRNDLCPTNLDQPVFTLKIRVQVYFVTNNQRVD